MKGISLSIETVILIILAAIVLAVLLAFMWNSINQGKNEVDLLRMQNMACGEIAHVDLKCGSRAALDIARDKLLAGNPAPCNPDRPSCTPTIGNDQAESCIKTCCKIFCPV